MREYIDLHKIWRSVYTAKLDMSVSIEDYNAFKQFRPESVLEFGSGLSTILFADMGAKILSFEQEDWVLASMKKIKHVWDKHAVLKKHTGIWPYSISGDYHMAFIDGPWSRTGQASVAIDHTDYIWVHDTDCECCKETIRFFDLAGWKEIKKIDNGKFGMTLWGK